MRSRADIAATVLRLGWAERVGQDPRLPPFHLDVEAHGDGELPSASLTTHVVAGRVGAACTEARVDCDAIAHARLHVETSRLIVLADPAVDDPLRVLLMPTTKIEASLDSLLYLAGLADRWIVALRQDVTTGRARHGRVAGPATR